MARWTLLGALVALAAVLVIGLQHTREATEAPHPSSNASADRPAPARTRSGLAPAQVAEKVALLSDPKAAQVVQEGALIELGVAHDRAAIDGIIAYALRQADEHRLEMACASLAVLDRQASQKALEHADGAGIEHLRSTYERVAAHGLTVSPQP
ncbi:MAG: hypothetical protein H0W83_00300 [Planctomycetes bacterium]|nr:hypothetical protein [Planctomycetota bacterium]